MWRTTWRGSLAMRRRARSAASARRWPRRSATPPSPPARAADPMRHFARLIFIWVTVFRFGLDELALSSFRQRWVRGLARVLTIGRRFTAPRGERLRRGLETLGPIFVKFGQVM